MTIKLLVTIILIVCSVSANNESDSAKNEMRFKSVGRQLIEEGRTMVHHAVKRFMIILPAIFFKLGIAFTLLIVVALAAVNNGFIGFLLLVVGLSSVLARLQDQRSAVSVPYISPLPPYHQHVWDRSDSVSDRNQNVKSSSYNSYLGQNGEYSPQMTGYYAKYAQNS